MRIGIVGVTGFGGSELLRLIAGHPHFELVWVGGESSAGVPLSKRFPALASRPEGGLTIERFEPQALPAIDLLFASLPTGGSRQPLAQVAPQIRIVDVGGDHRFTEDWVYGLTELAQQRAAIASARRVANPGCYPVAAVLALAPLLQHGLIEPDGIVVDAKSGVTGTGRGGASGFGFAETNEDLFAYGLAGHPHVPELRNALALAAGGPVSLAFTPHLVPMNRGLLATCYARPRGRIDAAMLADAARATYRDAAFVQVVEPENGRGPRTGWATASNYAFVSYAFDADCGQVIACGAIDNLGKGAAGQAVQNANLMCGFPETAGLTGLPARP
ncbi:MAG TPA: N-acetyl-gamma-glutamyl-phosphate reductase [Burkholderiaceae bacterium]|nr:N-acetyl-gamma-glutamyl-phosphate reductase [Burkholderiaceae bacterium]